MKILIRIIISAMVSGVSPRCRAQRVVIDPASGQFSWEEVYGGRILHFHPHSGKWTSIQAPAFVPNSGPEYTHYLWDGTSLFKFTPSLDNQSTQIALAQVGTIESGPGKQRGAKTAEWSWCAPVELPGKTLPLAVCQSRMLVEIPVRKEEGTRLDRKRILAEVDFGSGSITDLESIQLTAGQYFLAVGMLYEKEGLIFCNTGQVYKWNAKGGMRHFAKSFLEPIKSEILPPIDDGMTPYPAFLGSPFLGKDGEIILGIQYLAKSETKDPLPKPERVRTTFLAFDPRTGTGGRIDPSKWEHLFHQDADGSYWKLREDAGPRFGIDTAGCIQTLNMDRVLSETSTQPLSTPRRKPGRPRTQTP